MKKLKLFSLLMLLFVCIGQVWATAVYININTDSLGLSGSSYASNSTGVSIGGVTFKFTDANVSSGVNFKKSSGCLWNSSEMPQKIDSIVLFDVGYSSSSSAGFEMYGASSAKTTTTKLYDGDGTGKIVIDFITNNNYSYKYFYLKNKGTRTTHASSIRIYYTTTGGGSTDPTVLTDQPFTPFSSLIYNLAADQW